MGTDVASLPPALDGVLVLSGDLTVEQFVAAYPSDSNIELLDGRVYVSPAPGLPHARLVKGIERWLDAHLDGSHWVAYPTVNVRLAGPGRLPIPDITVVRASVTEGVWVVATDVLLVVEVLSPLSTAREDVRVKVPMYPEAGVTCWIVDGDRRRITASGDCIVDVRAAERHLFG